MSSIDRARSRFGIGKAIRLTGTVLTAATLAACAQSSVVTDKIRVACRQPVDRDKSRAEVIRCSQHSDGDRSGHRKT